MVTITLQWKRVSGQAGPGLEKELLVSAPFQLVLPVPQQHRRLSSTQMENKNTKRHLKGKLTSTTSKSPCDSFPSSLFSTTHTMSASCCSRAGKSHSQSCICSNPPRRGLGNPKFAGQGEGRHETRGQGKEQGDCEPPLRQCERLERAQGLATLCPLVSGVRSLQCSSGNSKEELSKVYRRGETLRRFTRQSCGSSALSILNRGNTRMSKRPPARAEPNPNQAL